MEFLYHALTVLHFIGWAIVLGGYLASMRTPGLYRGVFHGAMTALVAGVGMVGVAEVGDVADLNHAKIAVKLAITVVICISAGAAARQGRVKDNGTGPVTPGIKLAIGALTVVNIIVAVFWR